MNGGDGETVANPTDMIIRAALRIGIRPADFCYFTVGSLLDVLLDNAPGDEGGVRMATQADFDAF